MQCGCFHSPLYFFQCPVLSAAWGRDGCTLICIHRWLCWRLLSLDLGSTGDYDPDSTQYGDLAQARPRISHSNPPEGVVVELSEPRGRRRCLAFLCFFIVFLGSLSTFSPFFLK
jgi:hypothetical protein